MTVPSTTTDGAIEDADHFNLRLYIAGQTPKSLSAIANLKKLCREHLDGRCSLEIIDLRERPELAARDQVIAIPTLVRHLPPPLKRIIGNLADTDRVLVGLEIEPAGPAA